MKFPNVQGIILHHLRPCLLVTFSAYLSGIQRVLIIDLSNGPFWLKSLQMVKTSSLMCLEIGQPLKVPYCMGNLGNIANLTYRYLLQQWDFLSTPTHFIGTKRLLFISICVRVCLWPKNRSFYVCAQKCHYLWFFCSFCILRIKLRVFCILRIRFSIWWIRLSILCISLAFFAFHGLS